MLLDAKLLGGWEAAFRQQFRSRGDGPRVVHRQQVDRGPPDRRSSDDNGSDVSKVRRPLVATGIEKKNDLSRNRTIDCREIGSLPSITRNARIREILYGSKSAVLSGDNVLDLERSVGIKFGQQTVLAPKTGS